MDIRKIRKLIELIDETGVTEIEIKEGEQSVRLSKHVGTSLVVPPAAPVIQPSHPPAVETPSEASVADEHLFKAPMVGTFYASANPQAKPFVTEGQSVKAGDVLCIIEAMKMFNEIESDRSGVIKACLVENEQSLEYGHPMFVIEPQGRT